MAKIDWANFFNEKSPGLSYSKREFILNLAQSAGINPIVILSSLILHNEVNSVETKESEDEFHSRLANFTTGLKNEYYKNKDPNITDATYAVWMSVDKDNDKLKEFLDVFALLSERLQETPGHSSSETSRNAHNNHKRNPTEELSFPFPQHECWDIGR